jgi:hypothetical protein
MKISKDEAIEIVDDNNYVDNRLTDADAGLSSATYTVVFERNGKFYQFEDVDDGGFGPDDDRFPEEVECTEVEPYQETVTKYRPVKSKEAS